MKENDKTLRYVYPTSGVCPPEIHFQIQDGVLKDIRFVGGGCPGNAQLVSRLLKGRPTLELLELLNDIPCRNDTSCPDQLSKALISAQNDTLDPARSFNIQADSQQKDRIALIGDIKGRKDILESLIQCIREQEVESIICLGNLTGNSSNNKEVLELIRKEEILALQGELDFQYAQGKEAKNVPHLEQKERDYLVRLPQVLSFQLGEKRGIAFFGDYIQDLPGFSDFEPFALEMNMVCDLTVFLQDETVFPALETMAPQFEAKIVLFSQIGKWRHWQVGCVDFISVGSASSGDGLTWGLIAGSGEEFSFKVMEVR